MAKGRRSGGATGTSTGDAEKEKKEATPKPVIADVSAPSEAPRGKLEKLKWAKIIAWVLVGFVCGFIVKEIVKPKGQEAGRANVEFRYAPDLTLWQAVSDTSYWYPTKHAFYHTVEVELRPHEMVGIKTMGKYGFDKFIRRGWRNLDLITAEGFYMKPADLPRSQKPSQYALKSAGLGALLGAFGEVVYDADHIPHVDGTKNFFVGTECYVVVPDSLLPKLHLTLNERWVRGAWDDNDIGGMMVTITRYKPKT